MLSHILFYSLVLSAENKKALRKMLGTVTLTLNEIVLWTLWSTLLLFYSKPMMDLLIFLCAQYHLNPSSYTIDLQSAENNPIKFKPNTPIGMLEVEKVILKPKILDKKKPTPIIPEVWMSLGFWCLLAKILNWFFSYNLQLIFISNEIKMDFPG